MTRVWLSGNWPIKTYRGNIFPELSWVQLLKDIFLVISYYVCASGTLQHHWCSYWVHATVGLWLNNLFPLSNSIEWFKKDINLPNHHGMSPNQYHSHLFSVFWIGQEPVIRSGHLHVEGITLCIIVMVCPTSLSRMSDHLIIVLELSLAWLVDHSCKLYC